MIITIFVILLALTLCLFFLGTYLKITVLGLSASAFLFILGLVIMLGSITYVSGETSVNSYTYINNSIDQISENVSLVYSAWSSEVVAGIDINHLFGFFLSVIGILAFMNTYFNLSSGGKNED